VPQFDRGVYEPNDDSRVFHDMEEDEDVEGSRLPLLIVLALVVLAMFLGLVWLAYNEGVARGRGETPVLTAQNGPVRTAPANPGGSGQPYKGFKIYEQPAPPDDAADQPGAAPTPPRMQQQAAAPAPAPQPAQPNKLAQPSKPAHAAPPQAVAMAKPAPVPKTPAAAPKTGLSPAARAAARELHAPPPVSAPQANGQATGAPRSLGALQQPGSAPTASAPAQSGSYVLQIGAYKSDADAHAAWNSYKARHAALLAGYTPDVQRADLGAKGIWYRLRIAGFARKDVASAMCARLKADGGNCFLGR